MIFHFSCWFHHLCASCRHWPWHTRIQEKRWWQILFSPVYREEVDFPKCLFYPRIPCKLSLKERYELSLEWVLRQTYGLTVVILHISPWANGENSVTIHASPAQVNSTIAEARGTKCRSTRSILDWFLIPKRKIQDKCWSKWETRTTGTSWDWPGLKRTYGPPTERPTLLLSSVCLFHC